MNPTTDTTTDTASDTAPWAGTRAPTEPPPAPSARTGAGHRAPEPQLPDPRTEVGWLMGRPRARPGPRSWFDRHDRRLHGRIGEATTKDLAGATGAVWLALAAGAAVAGLLRGRPTAWLALAAVLAVAGPLTIRVWRWWLGWPGGVDGPVEGFHRSPRQRRMELLGREGLADHREVRLGFGSGRLLGAAHVLRPATVGTGAPVHAHDLGWCLGRSRGH
ncbi:MAG: hypothetical protein LBK95_18620, partial [Bifidobacteriaceae bacterium]|nr:hypothetical protein [Bifidobacteriaceae bacterium]